MQTNTLVDRSTLGRALFITLLVSGVVGFIQPSGTRAQPAITFTDIATDETSGITYRRQASATEALFEAQRQQPTYTIVDLIVGTPYNSRGMPGVALFDFDLDGDLDIYVTNGPGRANSLYASQLQESGLLTFVDMAESAGVEATAQDSTGVCYGDIDNDGDPDLLVLSSFEANHLFENQSDGTFTDISVSSGVAAIVTHSSSCSMGDVNNDGRLDFAVSNTFLMDTHEAILSEPFAKSQTNQLFINQGGNIFTDASASSGIQNLNLPGTAPADAAAVSWAVSLVDYDLDGDVDIFFADDQGAIPTLASGGVDRAYLQLYENDGTGAFTNVTIARGLDKPGDWMGLSFGDFNRDGTLDLFATNVGNYAGTALLGAEAYAALNEPRDSRWFLMQADGTYADANDLHGQLHTPFGWGTSAADYDNDGDTDIIFHGGINFGFFEVTAPGVVLRNDGQANFNRDTTALAQSTDHVRRAVYGMAVGDLNNDGFVDIASVSAFDYPDPTPLEPVEPLGSDFDDDAFTVPLFTSLDPSLPAVEAAHVFSGLEFPDGTLAVEINGAENANNWVQVDVLGTVGLTSGGQVNRDGIGAVVTFTPSSGQSVVQPILGGSSMLSQDSQLANFGLGTAQKGTVEILWPGGTRNRLDNVMAGSRILIPEIPCSFDNQEITFQAYRDCVQTALDELIQAQILDTSSRGRFLSAAIEAWNASH